MDFSRLITSSHEKTHRISGMIQKLDMAVVNILEFLHSLNCKICILQIFCIDSNVLLNLNVLNVLNFNAQLGYLVQNL